MSDRDSTEEGRGSAPEIGSAPIPAWLMGLVGFGVFWAGAYLFSYSGGFKPDVFDYQPKYGAQAGGKATVDPKVVGKALFSSNCITCHQATGQGVEGQYPPLAGSEVVLGGTTNHLIAIVLKGLQGPVQIEGKAFNNSMQAWEGQYSDQQLASILTYIRSDWGNNAPPITAEMVKQVRDQIKDRKEQWTWPEVQKIPPQDLTGGGAPGQPAAGQKPGAPAAQGGQPPAPAAGGQPAAPGGQPPAPAAQPANQGTTPPPAKSPSGK
jgi:mono/diheme cytochrome c family protein